MIYNSVSKYVNFKDFKMYIKYILKKTLLAYTFNYKKVIKIYKKHDIFQRGNLLQFFHPIR